jgi:hypothetical protein
MKEVASSREEHFSSRFCCDTVVSVFSGRQFLRSKTGEGWAVKQQKFDFKMTLKTAL